MKEYQSVINDGAQHLMNHTQLLQSLLLSKQNAGNNSYTDETTEGITDGIEQPSEGIPGTSSESHA